MASAAVITAVEARIAANWAGTFQDLNAGADPPADGSPFLVAQFPVANAEQISIGAPGAEVFREEGAIRFVYSIPRGAGVLPWQATLETLLALFRAKQFGGVNTWAPTSPTFDDSDADGQYWKITAVVPYYFDALG